MIALSFTTCRRSLLIAAVWLACMGTQSTLAADINVYQNSKSSADGIGKSYMGREIAGVMGWQAANWLERPERSKEERPELLLAELQLKPGLVVADIGAGSGYYSRRMSEVVGKTGQSLVHHRPAKCLIPARRRSGVKNIIVKHAKWKFAIVETTRILGDWR